MNADGQLTSAVAQKITPKLNETGYYVYYDHGDPSNPFVGTIPVSTEKTLTSKNQISQLDIAVVEKDTYKAVALIEIEETTDTPKTLIGDIFTTLIGDSVHLPRRENQAQVGNWTTLIIIGKSAGHDHRLEQIETIVNNAKSALGTGNSQMGNIVIAAFSEIKPLEEVLMNKIEEAIKRSI